MKVYFTFHSSLTCIKYWFPLLYNEDTLILSDLIPLSVGCLIGPPTNNQLKNLTIIHMPFPWWREGKGYLKMHICHWYTGQVLEIMLTAGCCDLQEVLKLKVGGWVCKGSQTAGQSDWLSKVQTFWLGHAMQSSGPHSTSNLDGTFWCIIASSSHYWMLSVDQMKQKKQRQAQ